MVTITNWIYLAIIGSFVLGMIIGMSVGRKKGMSDMLLKQQHLEATRMWAETLSKYMGGRNGTN